MNIDTDTQWAYWDGVRGFEAKTMIIYKVRLEILKVPKNLIKILRSTRLVTQG